MTYETNQAQAQRDPRSPLRCKFDAGWAAAKWHTYLLYCRTLYRPHMRLIHRYGWHWFKAYRPLGGPNFHKCEWCGRLRFDHD